MHHPCVAVLLVAMVGQLVYADCDTTAECKTSACNLKCCWDGEKQMSVPMDDCCCVNYACDPRCDEIVDDVKTAGTIILVVIIGSIICCILAIVGIVYCCIKSSQAKTVVLTHTAQPMMHQPMEHHGHGQPYNAMNVQGAPAKYP
ncbi:hypothetical protein DIPPA_70082 [Diplonema papillatum]|nr:hypothetical protein DIPPA_70082 [Diplonema papillatum]